MYIPGSKITSSAAESFNSVLKRCVERIDVNLQAISITIYQLYLYYLKQILKGYTNQGDLVQNSFKYMKRKESAIEYSHAHIPLEGLPYVFINKDILIKPSEGNIHTNFAVAKLLLAHGCVRLAAEERVFFASEMNSTKKYIVHLLPKAQCSCKGEAHCHHISACKMAINMDPQETKKTKLRKLIRKRREFKSGRKGNLKILILIEAASDCKAVKVDEGSKPLLVPTVTERGNLVKYRLLAIPEPSEASQSSNKSLIISTFEPMRTSTPERFSNKQIFIYERELYLSHLNPLKIKSH